MNEDKISIVVPVYNVENYLVRCIESILNQTYKNIEIILVDDGSTDSSGIMCDQYKTDSRFKIIHKDNEGLGIARNTGILYSTGKYIMFVDSDDFIDKDMIKNLYFDLKMKDADTCIGGFKRISQSSICVYRNHYAGKVFSFPNIVPNVLGKMFGKNNGTYDDHIEMSVWKVLFSAQIIKNNNLSFPSERKFISEDIIFDTDYFPHSKRVVMSEDVGYNYCDNANSLTTKYNPNRFTLQKQLFLELKKRAKRLEIYGLVNQRILNTFVANTRYTIKLDQKFLNDVEAKEKIRIICKDSVLQKALREYHVNEGIKSNIINKLILHNKINLLCKIMKLKNKLNI